MGKKEREVFSSWGSRRRLPIRFLDPLSPPNPRGIWSGGSLSMSCFVASSNQSMTLLGWLTPSFSWRSYNSTAVGTESLILRSLKPLTVQTLLWRSFLPKAREARTILGSLKLDHCLEEEDADDATLDVVVVLLASSFFCSSSVLELFLIILLLTWSSRSLRSAVNRYYDTNTYLCKPQNREIDRI